MLEARSSLTVHAMVQHQPIIVPDAIEYMHQEKDRYGTAASALKDDTPLQKTTKKK